MGFRKPRGLGAAMSAARSAPKLFTGDVAVPVRIEEIRELDRLREVDEGEVAKLAASIAAVGLQTPVLLRAFAEPDPADPTRWGEETPGLYALVAGAHRLAACRQLGLERVSAFVRRPATPDEARLLEIDENLVRADLTALDRARFLAERKRVYEAARPGSRWGGVREGGEGGGRSFAAAASEATGWAPRTIQRAVQIHEGLEPEVRERLVGTPLADREGALLKLARLDGRRQMKAADRLLLAAASDGKAAARRKRDGLARLQAAWKGASGAERRRFLAGLGVSAEAASGAGREPSPGAATG